MINIKSKKSSKEGRKKGRKEAHKKYDATKVTKKKYLEKMYLKVLVYHI